MAVTLYYIKSCPSFLNYIHHTHNMAHLWGRDMGRQCSKSKLQHLSLTFNLKCYVILYCFFFQDWTLSFESRALMIYSSWQCGWYIYIYIYMAIFKSFFLKELHFPYNFYLSDKGTCMVSGKYKPDCWWLIIPHSIMGTTLCLQFLIVKNLGMC